MGITEIYSTPGSKVLKAEVAAGKDMPEHYATSEAFVMVVKGEGELHIDGEKRVLQEGSTITIPDGKAHSMHILRDFQAFIVLSGDGEITFVNN